MLPRRDSRSHLRQPNAMPHAHSSAAFYSLVAPSPPAAPHPLPLVVPHKPKPTSVRVSFEAKTKTEWGDTVLVVGSVYQLGGWEPTRGLALATDAENCNCVEEDSNPQTCDNHPLSTGLRPLPSDPLWRGSTELPLVPCEYKLVILRAERDGKRHVEWEPFDGNRQLSFNGQCGVELRASSVWGGKEWMVWETTAAPSMLASQKPPVPLEGVGATPTTAQALASTEREIQKAAELVKALPPRSPAPRNSLTAMPAPLNSFSLPDAPRAATAEWEATTALKRLMAAHGGKALPQQEPPPPPPPDPPGPQQQAPRVGDRLSNIESCDGSWPPSEFSSASTFASHPASANASGCNLADTTCPSPNKLRATHQALHPAVDLATLTLQPRALARAS